MAIDLWRMRRCGGWNGKYQESRSRKKDYQIIVIDAATQTHVNPKTTERIRPIISLYLYTITADNGQLFLTKTVSFCFPFKQIVRLFALSS